MTVKGMEVAISRSDMARLKMKMFLAVLIVFLLSTAHITNKLPQTMKINVTVAVENICLQLPMSMSNIAQMSSD